MCKRIKCDFAGRTFTGAAISDVIVNGFDVARGARTFSEGVPRILILLTDGYSSDSIVDPEELVRMTREKNE